MWVILMVYLYIVLAFRYVLAGDTNNQCRDIIMFGQPFLEHSDYVMGSHELMDRLPKWKNNSSGETHATMSAFWTFMICRFLLLS